MPSGEEIELENRPSKQTQVVQDAEAKIEPELDVEHATVEDDPRKWSRTRKVRRCK